MRNWILMSVLAGAVLVTGTVEAQVGFSIEPGELVPGEEANAHVLIHNAAGPIDGWSIVICHEESDLSATGILNGSLFDDHEALFSFKDIFDDVIVMGVALDFTASPPVTLELGAHEAYHVVYSIASDAEETTLSFCTGGVPANSNGCIVLGDDAVPLTLTGLTLPLVLPDGADPEFLRGDASGNGAVVALNDATFLLRWQFAGGPDPGCFDAADADDNGDAAGLGDAIFLLTWAFAMGSAPPDPGASICGVDATADDIDCAAPPTCP